jgi:cystatin-C
MRTCTFLLVFAAMVIYAIGTPATGCGESYGNNAASGDGWKPIKDLNDKHIQDLGSWAVSEFLKYANCMLKFNKVVSGREQIVSGFGMNYELVINATAGKLGNYKAMVYEQHETKTRKLISFHRDN